MSSILKNSIQKYLNIYDVKGHMVCVNLQFYKRRNRKHASDDSTRWELRKPDIRIK